MSDSLECSCDVSYTCPRCQRRIDRELVRLNATEALEKAETLLKAPTKEHVLQESLLCLAQAVRFLLEDL